jgi:hypothetical protein
MCLWFINNDQLKIFIEKEKYAWKNLFNPEIYKNKPPFYNYIEKSFNSNIIQL